MKFPTPETLWTRHERLVLNIFVQALVELRNENDLPENEPMLNELLYVYTRTVWRQLPINEKPMWALNRNSENPPRTKAEIGEEWTRKKPDFQWSLADLQEKDPLKAIREYTIECKRLAAVTEGGWNFINEYIVAGIIRFLTEKHKYGIGTTSGAMIGYVQNMRHNDALEEINNVIQGTEGYKIPVIEFLKHFQSRDEIKQGTHTLNREKITPSIFDLRHIWVELMN